MLNNPLNDTLPTCDSRVIPDEKRLAMELGISFDGHDYRYQAYRYDQLTDALNYARLDRASQTYQGETGASAIWCEVPQPTEAEKRLMTRFAITFDSKGYHFETYRYDCFEDAFNYAQMTQQNASVASV